MLTKRILLILNLFILIKSFIQCEDEASTLYSCDSSSLDKIDEKGNTILHKLVLSNNVEELEEIFKCDIGGIISQENNEGWSALHLAIKGGYMDIIKLLIENGADIRVVAHNNNEMMLMTSLDIAMNYLPMNHEVINYIKHYKGPAVPTYEDATDKASIAATEGDLTVLKQISLSNHSLLFESDAQGWTPLHDATYRGHKHVVSFLLEQGADLSLETESGATALDICDRVLKLYSDVKHILLYYKPSHHAYYNISWSIISMLETDEYSNLSEQHFYEQYLTAIVENDFIKLIQMTKSKPNQISSFINKQDTNGWTPLHEAVRSKSILSIKFLLDKGASKYVENNNGETPIDLVNYYIEKFEGLLELLRKHIFLQSYSWKVAKLLMTTEL